MPTPMPTYKGTDSYIFISYSHRDKALVLPIVRRMQDDGFRIWFDDGVDPGTEWDDNIAGYINRCTVFIALITENYIASKNCKDELSYSRDLDKKQLLIYLKKVQLPDGLKMRMNRLQAIYWFRYTDQTDGAYETLYGAPGVSACRQATEKTLVEDAKESNPVSAPVETLPAPPTESLDKETKKNARQRRGTIIVCIAAVVFLSGLGIFLVGRGGQRQSAVDATPVPMESTAPASAETPATAPSESAATAPQRAEQTQPETYHVTLSADDRMTVKEFAEALEILTGRLDIFSEGAPCQMEVSGDTIELWLPREKLAGDGLEYTLRCYLTRATKLYAFQNLSRSDGQESSLMGNYAKIPISREELEQVTIHHGTVEGADPEALAELGIDVSGYTYLELVLTHDCAQKLAEISADMGAGHLSFGQDLDNSPWYYFITVPGKDGKTFYLIDMDQEDRFGQIIKYNLTHPSLAYSFSYAPDLSETTQWERVESPVALAGQNQCNAEDLTEQTVTFALRCYASGFTPGQRYDLHAALKARLDTLEIPYAIGVEERESDTLITVKCPLRHMGIPIIRMLGGNDCTLRTGLTRRSPYRSSLTYQQTANGSVEFLLDCSESMDALHALTEAADDGTVYLEIDSIPCLKTTLDNMSEDGQVTFGTLCLNKDTPFTQHTLWFARLLDTMWNGVPLNHKLYLQTLQYNPGPDGTKPTSDDFEFYDVASAQTVQTILSVCPDAKVVKHDTSDSIYIQLNLGIDGSLATKSLEIAESVYNAVYLANGARNDVTLYLVSENNDEMERARIFFQVKYNAFSSDVAGGIYARGIFCGGRLEAYKADMMNAVRASEFLARTSEGGKPAYDQWTWAL